MRQAYGVISIAIQMAASTIRELEAFYKSSLDRNYMKDIREKLHKTSNIKLKEWTSPGDRPVLIIKDATGSEDMKKLLDSSKTLEPWEMMVVFAKDGPYQWSKQLVVLKWGSGFLYGKKIDISGKNLECAKSIHNFLREEDAIPRPQTNRSTSGSDAEWVRSEATPGSDESIATLTSTTQEPVITVSVAFDHDPPDWLMEEAVSFVSSKCSIKLKKAESLTDTPLLVFCKNNTKLQEDISNAKLKTRDGPDVMLLVVTDKPDQKLVDTDANKGFGGKARLLWDHGRKKFRGRDNHDSLVWLRTFLQPFRVSAKVSLSRASSIRRSITKVNTTKMLGEYYVLYPGVQEEEVKNVVVFFEDKLIRLTKAQDPYTASPLVVFCAAGSHAEDTITAFLRQRLARDADTRDVIVLVFCRSHQQHPVLRDKNVQPSVQSVFLKDTGFQVADDAQTKNVAKILRTFLKKHTSPSARTALETEATFRTPRADSGDVHTFDMDVATAASSDYRTDSSVFRDYPQQNIGHSQKQYGEIRQGLNGSHGIAQTRSEGPQEPLQSVPAWIVSGEAHRTHLNLQQLKSRDDLDLDIWRQETHHPDTHSLLVATEGGTTDQTSIGTRVGGGRNRRRNVSAHSERARRPHHRGQIPGEFREESHGASYNTGAVNQNVSGYDPMDIAYIAEVETRHTPTKRQASQSIDDLAEEVGSRLNFKEDRKSNEDEKQDNNVRQPLSRRRRKAHRRTTR
ncbi:hypothetical protein BaRGS_00035500 [Batillaria attramentaria]|uniref:Uncharacterized protein n=1 Tax=Batillaria attramentaria TaxID=370345 RepID=A0ABD0JEB0_9CAEN